MVQQNYQSFKLTPFPSLKELVTILIQSTMYHTPLQTLHRTIKIITMIPHTTPRVLADTLSRTPAHRPAQHNKHDPNMKNKPVSNLNTPAVI